MMTVQEFNLGDHRIIVKETEEGTRIARLSSGLSGGVLEVEKKLDGQLRIKEMELGSAYISSEHLALLLFHAGASDEVLTQIQNIQAHYSKS